MPTGFENKPAGGSRQFAVHELTNIAWSMSNISKQDRPLLHAISAASIPSRRWLWPSQASFNPRKLAEIAWAMSGWLLPIPPLRDSISAAARRRIDITCTSWSCAQLQFPHRPLLSAISSSSIRPCAQLQFPHKPLLSAISSCSVANISKIAWSCDAWGFQHGPALESISCASRPRLSSYYSEQSLATLPWAVACHSRAAGHPLLDRIDVLDDLARGSGVEPSRLSVRDGMRRLLQAAAEELDDPVVCTAASTTSHPPRAASARHAAGRSEQAYTGAATPPIGGVVAPDQRFAGTAALRAHSIAAPRRISLYPALARVGEPRPRAGEETPIELIGHLARTGAQWTYPVCDKERRCYIGYLRAGGRRVIHLHNLFRRVHEGTDWLQYESSHYGGLQPRLTAWLVGPGCSCVYKYGDIAVKPQRFPPWMEELMAEIMPQCGLHQRASWPNSCNLNLYESGGHSLGWHSDNERLFRGCYADCRVISLSLGQARKFQIRLRSGAPHCHDLLLAPGDLCTMEGLTQKYYEHRVPPQAGIENPRINLTWRWVVDHTPTCRLAAPRGVSCAPHRPRRQS
eukprot:NODE_3604_length_2012_cov_6.201592.p1 GENE.NODE_3604_length_2012_cov_6.201592~~NODE_3604_length_2012_cov_6.201592.p1  ORF type:complete len:572 (+),score=65.21 NODE_3604_length_2012_cov_6.201592:126-1841(+)